MVVLRRPLARLHRTLVGIAAGLLLCAGPVRSARTEDPPDSPAVKAPAAARTVAVIQGQKVNLRVGPRAGGRPVAQLNDGTVLLVVERFSGWVCVHVPAGFLAAVAAEFLEPVGRDGVRVVASKLNMRVAPPEEGKAMPAAFRDRIPRGTVLPLVKREGAWVWVMAPETTRVYVSDRFVKHLGTPGEHAALLGTARGRRTTRLASLARERRERAAQRSGATLRVAIGSAQQALYRMRIERGRTRTPVVEVINALERAIEACRESPVGTRKLAHAVRQDLEAELEIRVARKDAEVARLRGLDPPAEKPVAPVLETLVVRGTIRWEAAPTWRNGGEWVLWVGEEPRYVLQLTVGLPQPVPDFKAHADGAVRSIEGRQPGGRVFGLPVIYVRRIKRP